MARGKVSKNSMAMENRKHLPKMGMCEECGEKNVELRGVRVYTESGKNRMVFRCKTCFK